MIRATVRQEEPAEPTLGLEGEPRRDDGKDLSNAWATRLFPAIQPY